MPLFSSFFLFFTMANIALPGSSSFIGEFLILLGIFKFNVLSSIFATLGVILCGSYSLWLYNRICFGNLKINYTIVYSDLNKKEIIILCILSILVLCLGIYPNILLSYLHFSSTNYILIFLQ